MLRSSRSTYRGLAAILALAAFTAWAHMGAFAQGAVSPAAHIDGLHRALIEAMKQGRQLGMKGRYDKLAPILFKTYDVPLMARIAVGASWDSMPPAQQARVVDAFSRMMVATYASRF